MVYASLILDTLPFHASEDFDSINAPDRLSSHATWSGLMFSLIIYIRIIKVQTEQDLKAEPQRVYYPTNKIPNSLDNIHLNTSHPLSYLEDDSL